MVIVHPVVVIDVKEIVCLGEDVDPAMIGAWVNLKVGKVTEKLSEALAANAVVLVPVPADIFIAMFAATALESTSVRRSSVISIIASKAVSVLLAAVAKTVSKGEMLVEESG